MRIWYFINMFLTLFKTGRGGDRYYTLHDLQRDLFAKYSLVIYSGTVGKKSNEKNYAFDTPGEKDAVLRALFLQKIKEGFKVIYNYPKELQLQFIA